MQDDGNQFSVLHLNLLLFDFNSLSLSLFASASFKVSLSLSLPLSLSILEITRRTNEEMKIKKIVLAAAAVAAIELSV